MATTKPMYSWDTQFDTANNTMTHTFSERVQVVSNIKTGVAAMLVDGNTKCERNGFKVDAYEEWLLDVERYAYQLAAADRRKALLGKVTLYAVIAIIILAFFALTGDNESWTLGQSFIHKGACMGVIGAGFLSIKHVPLLAAAQKRMDAELKEE